MNLLAHRLAKVLEHCWLGVELLEWGKAGMSAERESVEPRELTLQGNMGQQDGPAFNGA